MKALFNVSGRFGAFGRFGYFDTPHGRIHTPIFMPDGTRGAVKGLTIDQVKSTGINAILANTYHLHLQPGEDIIKTLGGLHSFGLWTGPILTDSGGFQVFSLKNLTKITEDGVEFKDPLTGDKRFISPEISMEIQIKLGADMIVAFDHLIGLSDTDRHKSKEAFDRTHRWLERCIAEYKRLTKDQDNRPILFGVVQGGLDLSLRKKSLDFIQSRDVGGIAIGGLSVGETHAEMVEVLSHLAPHYDDKRPRFLLGVGAPKDMRAAIDLGIDMFDCVLPTRNARHATVWVMGDKSIHLTNSQFKADSEVIDKSCDCYTCKTGYSKAFLRHMFKVNDPLAGSLASIHNLRYLVNLTELYKK